MSNVIDTVNMGYFIYDDVDTRDYDVQVYFKSVDSTPKRVGSFVSIPSRNGAFFVDEGRYEDMPHSYDIIALDPEEGKNIINAIARKTGHHRLEDSFNQDEFYQAIFVSAVEVRTETDRQYLKYALTFTRKPQRFLKSGESAVSKANNSTITNPTLFDAHPLLQFRSNGSDGTINLGEQEINVLNSYIGVTDLILSTNYERNGDNYDYRDTITIENTSVYKSGDRITLGGADAKFTFQISSPAYESYSMSYDNANGFVVKSFSKDVAFQTIELQGTECTFTAGTQGTVTKSIDLIVSNGSTQVGTGSVTLALNYNGASTVTALWNVVRTQYYNKRFYNNFSSYFGNVDSTKSTLENVDIYIDLDIGEAYSIDSSNNIVSLNNFVNLGGELPKLAPEITTITYTNITNFKITPRWWKI